MIILHSSVDEVKPEKEKKSKVTKVEQAGKTTLASVADWAKQATKKIWDSFIPGEYSYSYLYVLQCTIYTA